MTDPPPTTTHGPDGPPSPARAAAKVVVRVLALVAVLPLLAHYWFWSRVVGRHAAFRGAVQFLSLLPGLPGVYLRGAFLRRTLAACHPSATVEFGVLFSEPGAVLGADVYVGPRCILGLVRLERDVLIGSGVQVPSGAKTHRFDDPTRPIRDQGGERTVVTIGEGAWVGAGAIVLADVGKGTVVAAGSVVVKPLPEFVIAAGVPAKVVRSRSGPPAEGAADA
ncbi:MAG TPA: acyltransferase [Urbifossiella sp.]|jgi:acetyltransferase-like isoleucine patch superfamily enzyme|nr:acyltransferase [Urbifossiella sp.]